MPLNKVKPGSNMYSWVTHTHNHLAGACPHRCTYCSTQDMARRFPAIDDRYSGPPRLVEKELLVNYGTGKTIFAENCSDLFAEEIPSELIYDILHHCSCFATNTYVFQTKNPGRINEPDEDFRFPRYFLIGTTAEGNFDEPDQTQAPHVFERLKGLRRLNCPPDRKFITIEPIQRFFLDDFLPMLISARAQTIYIGADSKKHGLPEPTGQEIKALIDALRSAGMTVEMKSNLKRLYAGE